MNEVKKFKKTETKAYQILKILRNLGKLQLLQKIYFGAMTLNAMKYGKCR